MDIWEILKLSRHLKHYYRLTLVSRINSHHHQHHHHRYNYSGSSNCINLHYQPLNHHSAKLSGILNNRFNACLMIANRTGRPQLPGTLKLIQMDRNRDIQVMGINSIRCQVGFFKQLHIIFKSRLSTEQATEQVNKEN